MASGTIYITGGSEGVESKRIMMSLSVFECILDGVRANFLEENKECLQLCLRDWVECGLDDIDLGELDRECFNHFVEAAERGLLQLKSTGIVVGDRKVGPEFIDYLSREWAELMQLLREDPRNH